MKTLLLEIGLPFIVLPIAWLQNMRKVKSPTECFFFSCKFLVASLLFPLLYAKLRDMLLYAVLLLSAVVVLFSNFQVLPVLVALPLGIFAGALGGFYLVFVVALALTGPPGDNLRTSTPLSIKLAPGSRLRSLVRFLLKKTTFDKVFAPVLDDLHFEYIEALAEGGKYKPTYVYWRGVASFWMTFGVYLCGSLLGKVVRAFLAE